MSLNFSGASNGLTLGSLALNSTAFSFTCWVLATANSVGNNESVNILRDNNLTGKIIGLQYSGGAGTTTFGLVTPNGTYVTMFSPTLNKQYFFAYTVNGTTYTAYWSQAGGGGILNSNSGVDATSIGSYTDIWIGSDDAAHQWPGRLAAASVWSGVVLNTAQIQNQMASQKQVATASLFGQYPMFQQADGNIDFSGNGHTLTYPTTKPTTDVGPPSSWV